MGKDRDIKKLLQINAQIKDNEHDMYAKSEVLINISKDEIERARLLSELKYELDTQSNLVYAKREGIKEIIDLLKSGKSPHEIIRDYGST